MESEKKLLTDAQILRDYMDSIPHGIYNKVRDLIVAHCMVPKHTFKNWMQGYCRIPNLCKREINRISLEVSGIEIFTIVAPGAKAGGANDHVPGVIIIHRKNQ